MSIKSKITQSRVQANVDPAIKDVAESVIKEVGLTPTVVINSLYRKIAATGKIPLDFSLTPKQMADLELREVSKAVPVHELKTAKDIEEFFDEN